MKRLFEVIIMVATLDVVEGNVATVELSDRGAPTTVFMVTTDTEVFTVPLVEGHKFYAEWDTSTREVRATGSEEELEYMYHAARCKDGKGGIKDECR